MSSFLTSYGLFLSKAITLTLCGVAFISAVVAAVAKQKKEKPSEEVWINKINTKFESMQEIMEEEIFTKQEIKQKKKLKKKEEKKEKKLKKSAKHEPGNIYLIRFDGDIEASAVKELREAITAVLSVAKENDEVILNLESTGGMVHSYGLAAAQLDRIRQKNINLTVCVDLVAASGGYMMAAVANKIVASPFAILGSIGVVAEIPNFNKLLQKHDISIEHHTAGQYKTTLNTLAANTKEGREKFVSELSETHTLFKSFINSYRPSLDIEKVATGEYWYATQAINLGLVDDIMTSDDYLVQKSKEHDIFEVEYTFPQTLKDKLSNVIDLSLKKIIKTVIATNGKFKFKR